VRSHPTRCAIKRARDSLVFYNHESSIGLVNHGALPVASFHKRQFVARRLSQIINAIVCDIASMVASPTFRTYSNQC